MITFIQSHAHSKSGKFQSSKSYGKASTVLLVVTIVMGFIITFIGLLVCVVYAVAVSRCGFNRLDRCF